MSNDESEWGPWINHDGSGCPVPNGTLTHCVWEDGFELVAIVSANGRDSEDNPWVYIKGLPNIIRYRIRKPKGLVILEKLLQDLPTKVDQGVDA